MYQIINNNNIEIIFLSYNVFNSYLLQILGTYNNVTLMAKESKRIKTKKKKKK